MSDGTCQPRDNRWVIAFVHTTAGDLAGGVVVDAPARLS
jgi:hypothetical protein